METTVLLFLLFILALALFLGFELVSTIPSSQHLSFLSGSIAVSGIAVLAAVLAAGDGDDVSSLIGGCAAAFAAFQAVGAYTVNDQMPSVPDKQEEK